MVICGHTQTLLSQPYIVLSFFGCSDDSLRLCFLSVLYSLHLGLGHFFFSKVKYCLKDFNLVFWYWFLHFCWFLWQFFFFFISVLKIGEERCLVSWYKVNICVLFLLVLTIKKKKKSQRYMELGTKWIHSCFVSPWDRSRFPSDFLQRPWIFLY